MELLISACRVLEAADSTPPMKAVAAEALAVGVKEGLPIPRKAIKVIWGWLKTMPANRSWFAGEKIGSIDDEDVRADALRILDLDEAGDDLRDLAVHVLTGPAHAVHVGDDDLLRLLERAQSEACVGHVAHLIGSVHHARGVPTPFLRAVRDRWAASSSPAMRETAVDLSAMIVEPDLSFIERMLGDPNADVRCAVCRLVEFELPNKEFALGVVESRLRVEVHVDVRAALLRTQASVLDERQTRRNRRSR